MSLTELMVGLLVLSAVAGIALPTMSSSDPARVDAAAQEVADLIRFARDETIRTGTRLGFHFQGGQERVRAFRADMATNPPTVVYDVRDPLSKQLYDVDLQQATIYGGVEISGTWTWRGSCNTKRFMVFDASGAVACNDPLSVPLDLFVIDLTRGGAARQIQVDGFTGRVVIQ